MVSPLQLAQLVPARTDRVFITGQTGSGKTTLARVLLSFRRYVVVLDVKGTLNWQGYKVFRSLDKLAGVKPEDFPRIIYRPDFAELRDPESIDPFFQWVYDRRRTTCYIDETAGVTQGDNFPYHYGACLMRGREHGVEIWSATQRPMRIPQIAMSEAEHVFIFSQRMMQDRQRVSSLTSVPLESISTLRKRQFIYAPQDGEITGPMTLRLSSQTQQPLQAINL